MSPMSLLTELLSDLHGQYTILDALDEYRPGDVDHLLKEFEQLLSTPVRLFVTSRSGDYGLMESRAQEMKTTRLDGHPNYRGIRSYVDMRLAHIANA